MKVKILIVDYIIFWIDHYIKIQTKIVLNTVIKDKVDYLVDDFETEQKKNKD